MTSEAMAASHTGSPTDAASGAPGGAAKAAHDRSVLSIKSKLFLAFCAMAGLTILAAAIAWYAFVAIERSVDRITTESVPAMALSLRLAEMSTEIAATAPALMASVNQEARIAAQTKLEARSEELADLMHDLKATGIEPDTEASLVAIQEEIAQQLGGLNAAVKERLSLKVQREHRSADIAAAHGQLVESLEPLVDDAVFSLVISGEDLTARGTEAITGLVETGAQTVSRALGVPVYLGEVTQATMLLVILGMFLLQRYRIRRA